MNDACHARSHGEISNFGKALLLSVLVHVMLLSLLVHVSDFIHGKVSMAYILNRENKKPFITIYIFFSFICARCIDFASYYTIILIDFGAVRTAWYYFHMPTLCLNVKLLHFS